MPREKTRNCELIACLKVKKGKKTTFLDFQWYTVYCRV